MRAVNLPLLAAAITLGAWGSVAQYRWLEIAEKLLLTQWELTNTGAELRALEKEHRELQADYEELRDKLDAINGPYWP